MATTAQSRGWGPPCSGEIVTIVRSDGQKLPVRKEIATLIALLCDETERLGYDLKPGWSWGYACRKIRGSNAWSNHAWGLAVDLNAPENPMGPRNGKIRQHPKVILLWNHYGFRWGGSYNGRADDMHFEFMGTPTDAKKFTAQAYMEIRKGQQPGGDELTDEEKKMLVEIHKALYVKRDGKDQEHLNILEARVAALEKLILDKREGYPDPINRLAVIEADTKQIRQKLGT